MSEKLYVVSDQTCVVCTRVSNMPRPQVTSVRQRCAVCNAPIWVSRKAASLTWLRVCLPCVKRIARARATKQPKSALKTDDSA
jgi:hypothetical protein